MQRWCQLSGALPSKTLVKYSIQRILLKLKCCVTIGLFSPPFYHQHSTSSTHPKSLHDSPSPVQPSWSKLPLLTWTWSHYCPPISTFAPIHSILHLTLRMLFVKSKLELSFFWNPMSSSNPFHGLQGLIVPGLCFLPTSPPFPSHPVYFWSLITWTHLSTPLLHQSLSLDLPPQIARCQLHCHFFRQHSQPSHLKCPPAHLNFCHITFLRMLIVIWNHPLYFPVSYPSTQALSGPCWFLSS